MQIFKIRSPLR